MMDDLELNLDFFLDFSTAYPKCTVDDMHPDFVRKLAEAATIYPFRINSAYRSVAHERSRGRAGTSAHCAGRAVDISTKDSRTRYMVLDALRRAGFTRFGIGKTFIHVDDDVNGSRPEKCIFLE